MEDFIKFLLKPVVSDIELVKITKSESENHIEYSITAPKADMGHIIGKQGKLISAIRQLVRLKGIVGQQQVSLKLEETLE